MIGISRKCLGNFPLPFINISTDKELIHIKIDTSYGGLSLKFIGKLFSKGPV